jgi:hypothetical protein
MTTTTSITTIRQAFRILRISGIESREEILAAFQRAVKTAADGYGGYAGDMDDVTQAKEFLLAAWEKAQEQGKRDRARQEEEAERQQRKKRERRQREQEQQRAKEQAQEAERRQQEQATRRSGPQPRLEGPSTQAEEEAQAEPQPQGSPKQTEEREAQATGSGDPIAATLKTITAQLAEMERAHREAREAARKQEQARAEARKLLLANLDELEKVLQAIRTSLNAI